MSTFFDLRKEQPEHASLLKRVEDRSAWLKIEDKLLISALGGVWPEQPASAEYRRVLDVGCGAGGWLIETAKMYPAIPHLFGVDRRPRLIAHARELAREEGVADRVEFHVMDALCMLEFPFDFLDLVNIQMGGYIFRTWEWSKLLHECRRVTKPGGIIRAVEQDFVGESNSPAFNALMRLLIQTYYHAGYLFAPEHNGLLRAMPHLFDQFGVKHVQQRSVSLEFYAHTPEWQNFVQAMPPAITPFVAKWGRLPDHYEELCQQALEDVACPDFHAIWTLLVVWGNK
jgi:ubiquinone/menaquinone biosynthesis C-methylase UbiE